MPGVASGANLPGDEGAEMMYWVAGWLVLVAVITLLLIGTEDDK